MWGLTSSNGDAAHPRCQGDVGRCRSAPGEAGQTLPVPAPLGGAAAPPLPVRRAEPAGREPQGSLSCRGRAGGRGYYGGPLGKVSLRAQGHQWGKFRPPPGAGGDWGVKQGPGSPQVCQDILPAELASCRVRGFKPLGQWFYTG